MPGTVEAALREATGLLARAGIAEPRHEARLVIGHVLRVGPEVILGHPERAVAPAALRKIAALVAARARRRPMAQVLGRREFWSLTFEVTPDTLDPRPDSETVVAAALAALAALADRDPPLRLLDLGTGTGCLLLALLWELPGATGVGVDISGKACAVAQANAAALGLKDRAVFRVGDWGAGLDGAFDLIVVNPPYIAEGEIDALAPEVSRFEPRMALSGGPDGLASYRALAPQLGRLLAAGACAVVEVGAGQARAVAELFAGHGLVADTVHRDLGGVARCLVLRSCGDGAGGRG